MNDPGPLISSTYLDGQTEESPPVMFQDDPCDYVCLAIGRPNDDKWVPAALCSAQLAWDGTLLLWDTLHEVPMGLPILSTATFLTSQARRLAELYPDAIKVVSKDVPRYNLRLLGKSRFRASGDETCNNLWELKVAVTGTIRNFPIGRRNVLLSVRHKRHRLAIQYAFTPEAAVFCNSCGLESLQGEVCCKCIFGLASPLPTTPCTTEDYIRLIFEAFSIASQELTADFLSSVYEDPPLRFCAVARSYDDVFKEVLAGNKSGFAFTGYSVLEILSSANGTVTVLSATFNPYEPNARLLFYQAIASSNGRILDGRASSERSQESVEPRAC